MKAIVQDAYGSEEQLALRNMDEPVVGEDEVLVRVRAASVHPDVWHVLTGRPYVLRLMGSGLRRPRQPVPGTDMAGEVVSVGAEVTRFQPGDAVYGETLRGWQWRNGGAFAEYVAVPQDSLALKPENVTFVEAATVPTSGLITLINLPVERLRAPGPGPQRNRGAGAEAPDQALGLRVLVNGAGGGVGVIAVQVAKAYGAEVTGVDTPAKLDLIRSVGADRVIDYTSEDFTRSGEYDLILDIPGNRPFSQCRRALSPDGIYSLIGHDDYGKVGRRWLGSLPKFMKLVALAPFVKQLPRPNFSLPSKKELMAVLTDLLETGKLRPVVDRTFPLAEVPDAIRYLAAGGVQGKVVITV